MKNQQLLSGWAWARVFWVLLVLGLSGVLILPVGSVSASSSFSDLDQVEGVEDQAHILALAEAGVMTGYDLGGGVNVFRPYENVKRAQVAKVLAQAMDLKPHAEEAEQFDDVMEQVKSEVDRGWIGALAKAGITTGYENGNFGPYDDVTRQQLASFFIRALELEDLAEDLYEGEAMTLEGFKDAEQIDEAHEANVAMAQVIGLLQGRKDGSFGPQDPSKRVHLAKFGNLLFQPESREAMMEKAEGEREKYFAQSLPDEETTGAGEVDEGNEMPENSGGTNGAPVPGTEPSPAETPRTEVLRLFLDPGHGAHDPGARARVTGDVYLEEKDVNLDISLKIREVLTKEYSSVEVKMSRTTDVFVPLTQRAQMANEWGADYFVSIHVNSSPGGNASGFESYIWDGQVSEATKEKQRVIHGYIVDALELKDRGVKRANLAVLRETAMPAILIENLFINHPEDKAKLNDPAFREKLAKATAEGIAAAWNLPKK